MFSRKPQKKDHHSEERRFSSHADIKRSLGSQDENVLQEALTTLRNQLTLKYDEANPAANDERLLLLKEWLEASPGAEDIFRVWEATSSRQMSRLTLLVSVLSSILSLLSTHYTYHAHAQPIIKSLFSPKYLHYLNSYLGGSHTELLLVTLKLYYSLSNFAGGRERKNTFEAFPWETKSLQKLLHMRRRGKTEEQVDIMIKPDIRTLFVLFLLSFVDSTTPGAVKATFLEQRRDLFASLFKGLPQDQSSLIRRVLEVCWIGLWSDAKVRRTLKVNLFNEALLSQLVRIYDRDSSGSRSSEHIPADIVHHFLLAICTRPGVGICFKDRGWYPREEDPEEKPSRDANDFETSGNSRKNSKIYNKILANVLKTLKVNEDSRQQELAFKILAACPELVSGYWSSAAPALEPRLSSKWIANIAFYGSVVSLPVPKSTFFLNEGAGQALCQPAPPPLSTIMDNILPASNIKAHFSRGLQSSSALVQHCTALAIVRCLLKYEAVMGAFAEIERSLEEDEEGQWSRRRNEIEREVRKRVPDFQVVIGLSQKLGDANVPTTVEGSSSDKIVGAVSPTNPTKLALLAESAQRLLWLYHRSLPSLVAEARFDAGKLLAGFQEAIANSPSTSRSAIDGFDTLRQLHVLRLLEESEQFNWSGKTAGSPHSNFKILLKVYVSTTSRPVQTAIASLLQSALSNSLLFQHDHNEVALWLDALPSTSRSPDFKTADEVLLTDESSGVIAFLDDCAQQCVKIPYRYLEELDNLLSGSDGNDVPTTGQREDVPSPLLMTVLEQLSTKMKAKLLTASDALAVISYARKLVQRLCSKVLHLGILDRVVKKLGSITAVEEEALRPSNDLLSAAIRREGVFLGSSLRYLQRPDRATADMDVASAEIDKFIIGLEDSEIPSDAIARRSSALKAVDWFRTLHHSIDKSQITRLVRFVERVHKPALRDLFEYLRPDEHSVWDCIDIVGRYADLQNRLTFSLLFFHCDDIRLAGAHSRDLLSSSLFAKTVTLVEIKRAVMLINHRLAASESNATATGDMLFLLAAIVKRASAHFSQDKMDDLLRHTFQLDAIKQICSKSCASSVQKGLRELLSAFSDNAPEDTKQAVREVTAYWVLLIKDHSPSMTAEQKTAATLWIPQMETDALLNLLDELATQTTANADPAIIEAILSALIPVAERRPEFLKSHLPSLLMLRPLLSDSVLMDSLVAAATRGGLPLHHNGIHELTMEGSKLAECVSLSRQRWSHRTARAEINVQDFLTQHEISSAAVDVVTNLLYTQASSSAVVKEWLKSDSSTACSTSHLAKILFSLFDSASGEVFAGEDSDYIVPHFTRLVRTLSSGKTSRGHTETYSFIASGICIMIELLPQSRQKLLSVLQKECEKVTADTLRPEILSIVRDFGAGVVKTADALVETGLRWAVQTFSLGRLDDDVAEMLDALAPLLKLGSSVKSHLVEPVLSAGIQNHFANGEILQFMQALIDACSMKASIVHSRSQHPADYPQPVTVNKFLQSIVQHPQLYNTTAASRDGIVFLLHTLFHQHATNTCQPTHIEPLLPLYAGTLSLSDQRLLSIFRLFESTRRMSTATLCSRWNALSGATSGSTLEAVQSFDAARMFQTCLAFPRWRTVESNVFEKQGADGSLYDPVFVVSLFAQMLSEGEPKSALNWVQMFRTNVVNLLIRALSARDGQLRGMALALLAALHRSLQDADMQEKPDVLHILNLLKDALRPPADGDPEDEPPRLPAYTTLLLAHALRGVFNPHQFTYPLIARFLLQRPALDVGDVPLLFGMLYSATDEWRRERAWIVRLIADGMYGGTSEEWSVLRRRHTWELLASLFAGEERDGGVRRGILEAGLYGGVLANLTCHPRAATALVLKGSLLVWVEMQVRRVRADEALAWVRIMENVLTVVDPATTGGDWRDAIGRCILNVLESSACTKAVFVAAAPLVLRLSLLPGAPVSRLPRIIARGVGFLQSLEADVHVSSGQLLGSSGASLAPHSARGLFDAPDADAVRDWGACVEALWRATMAIDAPSVCAEWDDLTPRLLVWRAIAGEKESTVGEWARREVVRSLRGV
ncbi:hypothetical protein WOLCODRAFT_101082 [Wolfiporia cocos MD-104 SS10]|uniref:Uncharacterized protein n=1 Tax=Wolfiporia cocos (strain MD-104) TaxID=742152 RepID=A0A2H3JY85_WOLCO|nr:hypothetical protein WOLCODRAFT_101082 [Wolfiporia cocos MD-104 SS10]